MAQEKQFENKIKSWLVSQGIYEAGTPKQKIKLPVRGWFYKHWGGGNFGRAGIPDIVGCANGKFFAVEVKAARGSPSELQEKNIELITAGGGIGVILYPKDFDKFKNELLAGANL